MKINTFQLSIKTLLVLVMVCLFCGSMVYGDDMETIIKNLENMKEKIFEFLDYPDPAKKDTKKSCKHLKCHCHKKKEPEKPDLRRKNWETKFKEATTYLKDNYKELNGFNLSVAAGFNGNVAGENNILKLDVATGINKGLYPRAFQFNTSNSVTFKEGELLEEISKLQLSYEHYFSQGFKALGFIERTKNTFLSIKQRYEIGIGLGYEWVIRRPQKKKYKDNSCVFDDIENYINDLKTKLNKADTDLETIRKYIDHYEQFKEERKELFEAMNKRHSFLTIGVGVFLLADLEKADMAIPVYDAPTNTTGSDETNGNKIGTEPYSLNADERLRLVPQLSVIFRPHGSLTITGSYAHKFFLSDFTNLINPEIDKKDDWRSDLLIQIKYVMSKNPSWAKEVSVVLQYHRQFDYLPPFIPSTDYKAFKKNYEDANPGKYLDFNNTIAEKKHDAFQWSLQVKF